ncbi:hypothetical protein LINPERPRIM_LOCUS4768, partial [Linum perenne]
SPKPRPDRDAHPNPATPPDRPNLRRLLQPSRRHLESRRRPTHQTRLPAARVEARINPPLVFLQFLEFESISRMGKSKGKG